MRYPHICGTVDAVQRRPTLIPLSTGIGCLTFCGLLRICLPRPPPLTSNILMPTAMSLWAFLRPLGSLAAVALLCSEIYIQQISEYAAPREPRRGETPVTRASAVPAAALAWGSSVEYRQQRKSKKVAPQGAVPPRYAAAFSALRQKYGDRPPPLSFSHHPFYSLFHSSERPAFIPLLIPRTILIFVPQGTTQKIGGHCHEKEFYV